MIPALSLGLLHQVLASKTRNDATTTDPTAKPDGTAKTGKPATQLGAIAGDLGQLTTDVLSLLGGQPGSGTPSTTASQGAQAYAAVGRLR